MHKKDLVTIVFIAIMIVIVVVFVGEYLLRVEFAAEQIRKGCSPTASDQNGIPIKRRCPSSVFR
ncbi:MAG TPA: hypothetical protein VH500_03810 [Nitrososphaeraceae archaeon]